VLELQYVTQIPSASAKRGKHPIARSIFLCLANHIVMMIADWHEVATMLFARSFTKILSSAYCCKGVKLRKLGKSARGAIQS
jgi:hypothetical protein